MEQYLLYRAAELTVESGHTHFVIVRDDTERLTTYWFPVQYPDLRGDFRRNRLDTFRNDLPLSTRSVRAVNRYQATAEIVVFSDQPADAGMRAFDAREVLRYLGPKVVRPPIS